MRRIDRRRFLQGSGALLSLPFLESVPALASNHAPTRLVIFYVGQGMPMHLWTPQGTPANYTLNDIFQEPIEVDGQTIRLADLKEDITVIDGVDVATAMAESGNAHNLAAGHLLCATQMQPDGPENDYTQTGGPSFDSLIADFITPPEVPYKSLHYAVRTPWEICYTGAGQPVDRLTEPTQMIDSLFADFTNTDPAEFARLRARKQSVLNATKANIDTLNQKVSASDRNRLQEYLSRVEEIERRLNASMEVGEACYPLDPMDLDVSPLRTTDPQVDWFHPYYDPDIAAPAIIDVMVEALACDRSRCITLTLGDTSEWYWLRDQYGNTVRADQTGDWHEDVVHAYWGSMAGDALLEERLRVVARYQHALYASLLQKLKSRPEGSGTLLDNCVVLYVNEFGSETHMHDNQPFIIGGGGGGAITPGQWLSYGGEPHNRLLLSIMRMFGMQDATFGDANFCADGPLF